MERCAMYLRKSRADVEAEARGEGETLSKHKSVLLKYAKQHNVNIVKIRMEIVSGESLMHRPEMLELLKEVENGDYDGVLVMDMDRLGRGNMQEQGLILETFRNSNTKIVTPRKVYDLRNEFDEEYSEFEAFMARKELKIINRRLQGGRIRSVEEGNYIGTRPPYGYDIHKNERGERYLVPNPDQAPVVKLIFEWYTDDNPDKRKGSGKIATELRQMGKKTSTGKHWEPSTVLAIIKNEVYAGRIQWKKKEYKKSSEPGKVRDSKTRPKKEWIDVKGKHEPLVSEEIFQKAQEILKGKYHVPYQLENGITNPLAGLIKCDKCGASMIYRPYTTQPPHLICYNRFCDNKSTRFTFVEEALIGNLEAYIEQLKESVQKHKKETKTDNEIEVKQSAVKTLEKELIDLENQKGNLHDFLERGIYTVEVYLERSQLLAERIENTRRTIDDVKKAIEKEIKRTKKQKTVIPKLESAIRAYHRTNDPAKKNQLLKSILHYATYRKEKTQRNNQFTLNLYPKLQA